MSQKIIMRGLMRSVILTGALLPVVGFAEQTVVENIRIWAAPDNTRVVFDVSAPVEHKLEMLSGPPRLVIDIANTGISRALSQPQAEDRYLRRLRSARRGESDLRVVLDLKESVDTRSFLLQPHRQYGYRLVVDLFDKSRQNTADKAAADADNKRPEHVVIAIDAGHGGEDPGAIGSGGTLEKEITLQMAKRLAGLINQEFGMRAVLIREGDYFIGLRDRIQKARDRRADLLVSIHADAFKDPRVKGSSVYILSNRGASSEAARWLAEHENASDLIGGVSLDDKESTLASVLLDLSQTASLEASIGIAEKVLVKLKKLGKTHKDTVQSAGFAVLKSPDIPSILVETAYISNPDEEKKLKNIHYQERLAQTLLEGLKDHFHAYPPQGTLLAATSSRRKHVITRGETLSGIARRYRINTHTLRETNHLESDKIRVGQVLTIPSYK